MKNILWIFCFAPAVAFGDLVEALAVPEYNYLIAEAHATSATGTANLPSESTEDITNLEEELLRSTRANWWAAFGSLTM